MKANDVVTALAALAQDTRLAAYRLLVQQGPTGWRRARSPAGSTSRRPR